MKKPSSFASGDSPKENGPELLTVAEADIRRTEEDARITQ